MRMKISLSIFNNLNESLNSSFSFSNVKIAVIKIAAAVCAITVAKATPETPILKKITNRRFKITFIIPEINRM